MIYLILGVALMAFVAFGTYSGWIASPSTRQAEAPTVITDAIDSAKEAKDLIEQKSRDVAGGDMREISVPAGSELDLSNQGLTKVPGDVFSRTNLVSLDISHNKLTGALQAEVRYLSNLRTLDMSDNQYTGVPAEVGQLSKLEVLDLSNNQLTGLPYEFGSLSNLKVLDLRGNNYAKQDLDIIKAKLPATTEIRID